MRRVALLGALIVEAASGCATRGIRDAAVVDGAGIVAGAGETTGWDVIRCFAAATDDDADGLDDRCEYALARSFAPSLRLRRGACAWDSVASPARPVGGYLFAATPADGGLAVTVAFLPAYAQDCGWSGLKCLPVWWECRGHTGDSELIALRLEPGEGDRWITRAVFLSAHCFRDSACRWYAGQDLGRFAWRDEHALGAPIVWVAEGTNANYPSEPACDRGHTFLDTCDRVDYTLAYPIESAEQNIGSAGHPLGPLDPSGCVDAERLPLGSEGMTDATRECFWTDVPFRGWTRPAAGDAPTSYATYLLALLGFGPVPTAGAGAAARDAPAR